MWIRSTLVMFMTFVLTACGTTSSQEQVDQPVVNHGELADIYGYEVRKNTLWFRVKSTGCTRKQDFELVLEPVTNGDIQASLYRLKPDYCRAMPRIIGIEMSHTALSQQDKNLVLQNPIKDVSEFKTRPRQ